MATTAIAAGKPMRLVLVAALCALAQTASAQAIVPDPTLTPGAVRTTNLGEICFEDTRGLRHGSRERSDLIYERYGVAPADRMQYTLDHLIPLEIGAAAWSKISGRNRADPWPANGMMSPKINSSAGSRSWCAMASLSVA